MLQTIWNLLAVAFSDKPESDSKSEPTSEVQLLTKKNTKSQKQKSKTKVEQEYVELYQENRERIYNYVFLLVKSYDLAQDITANAFLKLYKRWDELHDHPNLIGWLYLVAKNEVIDHYRQARNKKSITFAEMEYVKSDDEGGQPIDEKIFDVESYESLIQEMISEEQNQLMQKLLQTLSVDDQTIVYLRYYEELPYAEIAVIYNKSEDAMKMYVHRLMKKLTKKYKELEPDKSKEESNE